MAVKTGTRIMATNIYYNDDGNGDEEMKMAMKQMNRAMRDIEVAKKQAAAAKKQAAAMKKVHNIASQQNASARAGGGTVIQQEDGKSSTIINIQSANNIQVGTHNTMIVYSKPKSGGRKVRKPSRHSSSEDDTKDTKDSDKMTQALAKDPKDMTEDEKRIYNILHSEEEVKQQDLTLVSANIGKEWRRFLRYLDLTDTQLEELQLNYMRTEGVREVILQGLRQWKQRSDTATLGSLCQALQKLGVMSVVKLLCDNQPRIKGLSTAV